MSNEFIIYVADVESTGLIAAEHDVIEISMCRLIPKNNSYEEEQKTWLLKAMNPRTIQDEALKVNGHKKEDITWASKFGRDNYRLPTEVVDEIEAWMMEDGVSSIDRIFAGQNPNFDIQMLQELWKRCGRASEDDFPFFVRNGNRIIDTKQVVALFDVCTGRRRKYYGLSSLVKAIGIKKAKAHTAAGDVAMTKDLLIKLVSLIKDSVIDQFKDCYSDEDTV